LNYGERGQYSDDAHVESAAEQSARPGRGLSQCGLFFRNAQFVITPTPASNGAVSRAFGALLSTATGDNWAGFCMQGKPRSETRRAGDYAEASIRVLKGLEPVRQRPGMYTRTDSPLHIVQEIIDNASDEILAGFGHRIDVTLHTDGSVTVEDDGRGIPVGLHPEEKAPVVEIVFTRLHAGGKFDKRAGGAYSFAGGLHGVGVSVTNALSAKLDVTVFRDGKLHTIAFADGEVSQPLRSEAA